MAESVRTLLRHCLLKLKFLLGTIRPSGVSATSENATSDQLPSAPRQSDATDEERTKSCRTVATVIYALQGLAFLFAIPLILPSIVAVVIAHIKISEVRGTWLESHFLWQIRTFWFGLLWMIISVVIPLYLFELRALVVNASGCDCNLADLSSRQGVAAPERRQGNVPGNPTPDRPLDSIAGRAPCFSSQAPAENPTATGAGKQLLM